MVKATSSRRKTVHRSKWGQAQQGIYDAKAVVQAIANRSTAQHLMPNKKLEDDWNELLKKLD